MGNAMSDGDKVEAIPTQSKDLREKIDDEFRRRQVAAGELVRFGRGDRGHIPVRKTVRASRGTAEFLLGGRRRSALVSEAAVFRLRSGLGLVFVLLRSSARNRVIGARPQIDEYVLDVAHDV